MSFETTIFIHGVGTYLVERPDNRDTLRVLFPNQERAQDRGLRDPNDENFCNHKSVLWATTKGTPFEKEIGQHWVSFATEPDVPPFTFVPRASDGGIYGLPRLKDFVEAAKWEKASVPSEPPEEDLTAIFEARAGVLGPDSNYLGSWDIFSGAPNERTELFSSVMKLELGYLDEFTLLLRSFGSADVERIVLEPSGDVLDVWLRHHCDENWPPRPQHASQSGQPDNDFVLNYALIPDIANRDLTQVTVPHVDKSWIAGGPIGGDPVLCMGNQGP